MMNGEKMQIKTVCFLFVSIQIISFSALGYSENVRPGSNQNADELSEKTKQDLEKLKQSVEDMKKSGEEVKKSEELKVKTGPLIDKAGALLKQEKYEGAKATIKEWEKIDSKNAQISLWRDLIAKLEKEPDQEKRSELYLQFLNHQMAGLIDNLDTMNQSLIKLNENLKELGPQNAEEELCNAVTEKNKVKVEELLGKGVSANAKDRFGNTALSGAAWQGSTVIVKLLLAHGADVNAKELLDLTALISAASKGQADIVRVLLNAGADVNAKAKTGVTALSAAKKNGYTDIVELLKQAGAKE